MSIGLWDVSTTNIIFIILDQYYSLLSKNFKQVSKKLFWFFGAIKKMQKQLTFGDDLGMIIYDCIWLIMMYIIEKHCIKWFPLLISQENIQKTSKCEEMHLNKYGKQKKELVTAESRRPRHV